MIADVTSGLSQWWAPALAFAAGVVSFASPCVFPLVPGYLAFVSGGDREERRPLLPILLFILGFAAVFTLLGVSIAALPLLAGRFWEYNRNKALVSLFLGVPVALWVGVLEPRAVGHAALEYLSFVLLLGALFVPELRTPERVRVQLDVLGALAEQADFVTVRAGTDSTAGDVAEALLA